MTIGKPQKPAVPRLAKGADDGYTSEGEELSGSYFEGVSRERDRKLQPDAKLRRQQREHARTTAFKIYMPPAGLVRGEEYIFSQGGPNCRTWCFIFIALRQMGYPPKQVISICNSKILSAYVEKTQESYAERATLTSAKISLGQIESEHASEVVRSVRAMAHLLPKLATPDKTALRAKWAKEDLFYSKMTGAFSRVDWGNNEAMDTFLRYPTASGSHAVKVNTHVPSRVLAPTFQQTLFATYQPCQERHVAAAQGLGLVRSALPFVELCYYFPRNRTGKVDTLSGHSILVDLSDPLHPGIFDPNFGWMAPAQAHCWMSIEQALHVLWQHYVAEPSTRFDTTGFRFIGAPDDVNTFVFATQLYMEGARTGKAFGASDKKPAPGS